MAEEDRGGRGEQREKEEEHVGSQWPYALKVLLPSERTVEPLHIGLWGTLKIQIMVDKPRTSEKHTISQKENRKGVALRGGERKRS